jgi:Domain of unknown function (DUF4397)
VIRTRVLGAGAALALAAVGLGAAPASAADTATVSVLHAVPGVTVDVYANGQKLLTGFTPGTLTDPMQIPAGSYDIAVYPTGADPSTTQPAASAKGVGVPAGANATLVANLTEQGQPTLNAFVNDVSPVPAGKARVTVRHVAAAPAVDVRANGTPVVTGLTNPAEKSLVTDAGTVSADVVLAGTSTVAIGPASLDLAEGSNTVVYAWGSQQAGYQLAVQGLSGMSSAPGGVPAGSGGLVDDGLPLPLVGISLAGLLVASLAGLRLAGVRPVGRRG